MLLRYVLWCLDMKGDGPLCSVTLTVPLQIRPSADECAGLVQKLLQHCWFMRNQTPCLFEHLQPNREEEEGSDTEDGTASTRRRRRKRISGGDRKIQKVWSSSLSIRKLLPYKQGCLKLVTSIRQCDRQSTAAGTMRCSMECSIWRCQWDVESWLS